MVHPLGYRVEDDSILAPLGWLKLSEDAQQSQARRPDDASVSERSLSFTAIATDGGEYSSIHSHDNLCLDDLSCYSSAIGRSAAVNVTAKWQGQGTCTIEGVTIRVPVEGYNSLVAQAIVFASLGEPCVEQLASFDAVQTEQDYKQEVQRWAHQAHINPSIPKPVAFVSMRGRHAVRVPAAVPRSCKYVVVKLLRPSGNGNNVDVEYVGLHGWFGRRCCPCRQPIIK